MGRYVGKCEGEEIVVDVKIRTRAMAKAKRMKKMITTAATTMANITVTSTASYNVYDLRSRPRPRRVARCLSETTSLGNTVNPTSSSAGSDVIVGCSELLPALSCSSSNITAAAANSTGEIVENCVTVNPEIAVNHESECQEVESSEVSSKFIDDNNLTSRSVEVMKMEEVEIESRNHAAIRKSTVQINSLMMPSQSEIDEFFSSAEKDLQKRFSDKYNFDVVKEVPLEGRYEWDQVTP